MRWLRLMRIVARSLGVAFGAAERALTVATALRNPAPGEPRDPDGPRAVRTAFPSQGSSAALLDPYLEFARARSGALRASGSTW